MEWVPPFHRARLSELLQRHQDEVKELAYALRDEITAAQDIGFVDDVWLLRYVLGFEQTSWKVRAKAAKKAIKWRKENLDMIEAAKFRDPSRIFSIQDLLTLDAFFIGRVHCVSQFGDPLYVSRAASVNVDVLLDSLGQDKLELWLSFTNECHWQYCEAATRERGFFVKQINISDFNNLTVAKVKPVANILGKSSKINDWLRPLMVGKTILFNMPGWLRMASKVVYAVMSKKAVERIHIYDDHKELILLVKALVGIQWQGLPTFLGGSCDCRDSFPAETRDSIRQHPSGSTAVDVGKAFFSALPHFKSFTDEDAMRSRANSGDAAEVPFEQKITDEVVRLGHASTEDGRFTFPPSPGEPRKALFHLFSASELDLLNQSSSSIMAEHGWHRLRWPSCCSCHCWPQVRRTGRTLNVHRGRIGECAERRHRTSNASDVQWFTTVQRASNVRSASDMPMARERKMFEGYRFVD